MDLTPHIEKLRREFARGAELGGDEARELAERLSGQLESAIRLTLLDALSAAADEITRELAPGSAELRLRSGDPDFVVTPAPVDEPAELVSVTVPPLEAESDDGATARINLRLPEQLKASIEQAAGHERLSVNAWLVRVLATAVAHGDRDQGPRQRSGRVGQSYSGWVR
jgi:hypothetical protein